MIKALVKHPLGALGSAVVVFLLLVAVLAPVISPYDPFAINVKEVLAPPSLAHPCGTDLLGRDVLSRLIYGARISLEVGILAVGISLALGVILGALAGYYGGVVDSLISRAIDIMLCFPTIFLILAVI
ncbi:MAG TPA: peptide ABC transporter permease, partial [Thermodesulfatator atlanticus]|nr:peptide ABC transporter permease [Thermodesulfatator atlanticus]